MSGPVKSQAIVAYPPEGQGPNWKWEEVTIDKSPADNEVATGVCHTDIVLTSVPPGVLGIEYPKIVGHEGSGYVKAIGPKVTTVAVGDPVLLSFDHCKSCRNCSNAHPGNCKDFDPLNYNGSPAKFKSASSEDVWGKFFGQSSFANYSLASEHSILNVKDLIKDKEELKLFAPLGCGVQTGAGTILNVGRADTTSYVVILGLGGVGLSAIMAAKIVRAKAIVAVDRVKSRLDMAKSLGATHVLNTSEEGMDLTKSVFEATDNEGASICLDTTGAPALLDVGIGLLGKGGKLCLVGVPPMDYKMDVSAMAILAPSKSIVGAIEGDVEPGKFIPQMIKWYREGKFPLDKMVKYVPVAKFSEALAGMHSGEIIKPVLIW